VFASTLDTANGSSKTGGVASSLRQSLREPDSALLLLREAVPEYAGSTSLHGFEI
jgi:hypothetical protein